MRSSVSSQHSRPPNFVLSGGPGDPQLLHEWLLVLRGDGKSKMTIEGYHNSLKQLVAFVIEGGYPSLASLSAEHIREWLNALRDRGNKPATVNTRYRAAHGFYQWLLREGEVRDDMVFRNAIRDMWVNLATRSIERLDEKRRVVGRGYKKRDWDDAVAALVPAPQLRMSDLDVGSTLSNVKPDWIDLERMGAFVDRWITSAAGNPKYVESLVGFVRTLPIDQQLGRGLDLVADVVGHAFDKVASHTWTLTEWLKELQVAQTSAGTRIAKFQILVDGLAAHGDIGAARLQQSLE